MPGQVGAGVAAAPAGGELIVPGFVALMPLMLVLVETLLGHLLVIPADFLALERV